ncbi:MAG: beta-ketoacyl-ACP synthase II [Acidobacteria bacterium]|nr:beta-ketoacyl-ACP synthase II [Acidobacteriota bacterium]MCB9397584.1 beta-ketoacyl-ACP synthase II [Acidobacteriota bacterium]
MRRVVVTGLGALSPLGNSVQSTFEGLISGKSGIGPITKFDASEYSCQIAGEVRDLDISLYMSNKEAKKMDTFIHYGLVAAEEAIKDSGLVLDQLDLTRFGVYIGSGIGGLPMIEREHKVLLEKGPRRITPFFIPSLIINLASGQVSIRFGLKGPNSAAVTACATGSHSIGDAFRLIQRGDADFMIAGGTEAVVSPLAVGGFAAMRALSTRNDDPQHASRPFDVARDGFVLGEGCGVLVMETLEHAQKRGAKIYGEIIGYGMSGDAYHITSPSEDGDGPVRAMRAALKDAQVEPHQVQLVNAHGTSTPAGDVIEARAIQTVFGAHPIMVHSTKSMTGHLLGAAGGVEAVVVCKTLETGLIHPTANLENQDPEITIDAVPGQTREAKVQIAMSNSFGFGGTNATLLFRKI